MKDLTEMPTTAVHVVSVQDLSEQTGPILRRVSELGEIIEVVDEGKTLARLVPSARRPVDPDALAAWWAEVDKLAAEIGAKWPKGVSAADAIKEDRREL